MKSHTKLAAAALTALCYSSFANAQEPTKEETIDWLREKIPQASSGCKVDGERDKGTNRHEIYRSFPSSKLIYQSNNNLYRIQQTYRYEYSKGPYSGDTKSYWNTFTFDPTAIISLSIESPETEADPSSGSFREANCTKLFMEFAYPIPIDESQASLRSMGIYVRDPQLAARMKSALEHWIKLEKSGAGEPF